MTKTMEQENYQRIYNLLTSIKKNIDGQHEFLTTNKFIFIEDIKWIKFDVDRLYKDAKQLMKDKQQ